MNPIEAEVVGWLNSVVIGLNLCPFAGRPTAEKRVRFFISDGFKEEQLLEDIDRELALLENTPGVQLETTLVIIPNALQDFYDYTCFLDWANAHLKREGWQGKFQLASFHPNYCFSGAEPEDTENLTNRAPYPIVHIIREASLSAALHYVDDVEGIPERNRARVEALTAGEKQKLFPYLFRAR